MSKSPKFTDTTHETYDNHYWQVPIWQSATYTPVFLQDSVELTQTSTCVAHTCICLFGHEKSTHKTNEKSTPIMWTFGDLPWACAPSSQGNWTLKIAQIAKIQTAWQCNMLTVCDSKPCYLIFVQDMLQCVTHISNCWRIYWGWDGCTLHAKLLTSRECN